MAGASNRLSSLRLERENLIDRWISDKSSDKARILVQIMDLEEDIARVLKEQQSTGRRKFH